MPFVPFFFTYQVSQVLCCFLTSRRRKEKEKNHLFFSASSSPPPPLSSASSSASASSFDFTKSVKASGCLTMQACIASNAPRHSGALAPPPLVAACCEEEDLRKHEKAARNEGPQGPSRKSAMQGHARASWMFRSTCSGVKGAPSLEVLE